MKENLVTIVVLPNSKAHQLKLQLEAEQIECDLEEINLIEGATSSTVRVKIPQSQIKKALPVVEDLLGVKPFVIQQSEDKKDKHILVPVDFSESSEKATKLAINIATHLNMKLIFFHCYINPVVYSVPFSDIYAYDSSLLVRVEYTEENAHTNFRKFISKISKQVGKENWKKVSPEYIIKPGYPEEDIVAFAHKNQSQLIVMGSGKKGGYETLGSVVTDIMYNAKVPLLVVPEDAQEQILTDISSVLYATNFDEKDFVVLNKVMTFLKPFKTRLICAHVGLPKGDNWDIARLEGMKDILYKKYNNSEFECNLITGDNPIESLDKFIAEKKVSLLILTTHKRNMITRLFNPSFSKKMMFHTNTPLLIFHI